MERELQKLEEAIKHYRECVDVGADEYNMNNAIYQLSIACYNVGNNCVAMLENI